MIRYLLGILCLGFAHPTFTNAQTPTDLTYNCTASASSTGWSSKSNLVLEIKTITDGFRGDPDYGSTLGSILFKDLNITLTVRISQYLNKPGYSISVTHRDAQNSTEFTTDENFTGQLPNDFQTNTYSYPDNKNLSDISIYCNRS